MDRLFLFPKAVRRDPAIDQWLRELGEEFCVIARRWFEEIRGCGSDVREILHDGHPTACVGEAAFAYVDAFTTHVNVGFFRGAELSDPGRLLEGSGKMMRHVKLQPGRDIDALALRKLIKSAYEDVRRRLNDDQLRLS